MQSTTCPLCLDRSTGTALWQNDKLRVIDAAEAGFPGYTRVIWHSHVSEMTDLDASARQHMMDAVWIVENTLRNELNPLKINIAQFGNYVPHLHWHIIPRWPLDSRFPDAIWAAARERSPEQQLAWEIFCEQQTRLVPAFHAALRQSLDSLG